MLSLSVNLLQHTKLCSFLGHGTLWPSSAYGTFLNDKLHLLHAVISIKDHCLAQHQIMIANTLISRNGTVCHLPWVTLFTRSVPLSKRFPCMWAFKTVWSCSNNREWREKGLLGRLKRLRGDEWDLSRSIGRERRDWSLQMALVTMAMEGSASASFQKAARTSMTFTQTARASSA